MSSLRGIPSILFADTFSGILRFLPLTLTVTFFFLGIMLNNMPWLIASMGAITVWIGVAIVHFLTQGGPRNIAGFNLFGYMPDIYAQSCSLIPGNSYAQLPSLWFTLMGYFFSYIILNANSIYTRPAAASPSYSPTGMGKNVLVSQPQVASTNSIGVVQRRSVGLLSIIAVCTLFAIIMVPRFMNQCESILGILTGLLLGSLLGGGFWAAAHSNQNPLSDIHGVVLGLSPGYLRHTPIACTPSV
jgi:hypothetical protein